VRSAKAAAERDVAGETHPSDPWVCAHRIGVLAGFCVPWFQGSFIAASLCAHGCAYACVYMWEGGGVQHGVGASSTTVRHGAARASGSM
jgi:hypothetical protein